jgi:hypothetical protein
MAVISLAAMKRLTTNGCPGYANPMLMVPMIKPNPMKPVCTPVSLPSATVPIALILKIKSPKPPIITNIKTRGKNNATTSMRIAWIESVRLTAQNPPINV